MKIEIKTIFGELIFEGDFSSISKAVEAALAAKKSLSFAELSSADLNSADLSSANLRSANLSFADLSSANLSFADLSSANLNSADLSSANLRSANLSFAELSSADLSSADLSSANLRSADLNSANLSFANLRSAELRSMLKIPKINSRILEAIEGTGKLEMSTWHTCETTHCRAGWAIHLLGEKGKLLEAMMGPSAAGALIYASSDPGKIPNFTCSNKEALEDLKARAALEVEAKS